MAIHIPRLNSIVEVMFLDHVANDVNVAPVVVYGQLIRKGKESITVETWCHPDPATRDQFSEADSAKFSIVKSAIREIYQLKRVKPPQPRKRRYSLRHCEKCMQMTNHHKKVCQKCKGR